MPNLCHDPFCCKRKSTFFVGYKVAASVEGIWLNVVHAGMSGWLRRDGEITQKYMKAQFIAIPVAQGDAFYLKRNDFSVLVDGGRSCSAFPMLFRQTTKANGVDILVCTHNDADHANGILGFLKAGLKCNELWLPGRWLTALPGTLKPFPEVFFTLAHEIAVDLSDDRNKGLVDKLVTEDSNQPSTGSALIEIYAEHMRKHDEPTAARHNERSERIGKDGWTESCVEMLEKAEPWDAHYPYFMALQGFVWVGGDLA